MTTTNDGGKDPKNIVMATVTYDDGREEKITGARFIELLQAYTSNTLIDGRPPKGPDDEKEELEVLAEMLRFVIDFAISPEGAPEEWGNDEKIQQSLKIILKRVNWILEHFEEWEEQRKAGEIPQADGRIAEFLKGQRDFLPVARPRQMEDFLKINDSGAGVTRKFKNSTITFTGRLGLDEQKIAEMLRMSFTEMNPYKATKNLKTLVSLSLTDTMTALGRTVNPNNKKMFVRQLTREILPTIAHAHITLEFTKNEVVEVMHMEIGGGYFEASTRKDRVLFRFSPEYAQYINTNSLSQYHKNSFRLGSARNPLPFYLNMKLQDHYFKDANRQRGTNMILSVSSILEFCADTLEYEYILETDPTHWKRKIKERLERALDEIQAGGIFKWSYCGAALKEIPQAKIEGADFYEWSKLYITFQLIPEEPDQSERLQRKQERIEAAREKKELEDDRTTVEADRIRKRRRKKAAQNSKKGSTQAPKG